MNKIFTLLCCIVAPLVLSAQQSAVEDSTVKKITIFEDEKPLYDHMLYGRSQVISRADIEAAPVQTLEGVLSTAMGISTKSFGPMGSLSQLQGRGWGFGGVIVLVNGRRANSLLNDIYTLDNISFSLDMIERIEIRTGGDSKRWGEFATQATVNIITRSKIADSGVQVNAYGGNLSTFGGQATAGIEGKKSSTILNISGRNQSEESYKHSQAKTYVESTYSLFKWADVVTSGAFAYNKYNAPFLFTDDSKEIESLNNYNFEGSMTLNLKLSKRTKFWASYTYTHFKQQYDPFNLRDTPMDSPYAEYYLDQVQYTNYRNQIVDLGGSYVARMIELNFGFIHNSSKFKSSYILADQLKEWYKVPGHEYNFYKYQGIRDSWNAYYNMTIKFKQWYANAGISVNSSPVYTKLTFAFGGEFGYKLSNKTSIFFGYDSSFKNGDFYQQYILTEYVKGNDDFNNEKVSAFNLGLKRDGDFSKLYLGAYIQSTKEAIILKYNKSSERFDYSNASFDDIMGMGIEASYKINIDKATSGSVPITNLSLSYNYNHCDLSDSTVILTNNYLRNNLKVSLSARLFSNLYIDADYNLQDRVGMFITSPSAKKENYPWLSLLNARVAWKAPDMRYQIYIQGNNIFNQRYYNAQYIPSAGASVSLGVSYNFSLSGKK